MATTENAWMIRVCPDCGSRIQGAGHFCTAATKWSYRDGELVEVVRRSELERVEAERDLALRALGHDSYEAAQQYLRAVLSGPAPAGWADQR